MAKRKKKFRPGGGRSKRNGQGASAGKSVKRAAVPVNPLKKQLEAMNALRRAMEREKERRAERAGSTVAGRNCIRGGGQAGE